eukprot:gene44968-60022_t
MNVNPDIPATDDNRPKSPGGPVRRQAPEPLVNAPWPVVVLTVGIVVAYLIQSRFPLDAVSAAFGFSPAGLLDGRPERLLTSLFVHGNWAHALMNAAFILAFGAPVARFFGPKPGGAIDFFLFYLVCGILACLGFAALHWGQDASLIGASGAASGLMGAAARLIGGNGRVGPLFSKAGQPGQGQGQGRGGQSQTADGNTSDEQNGRPENRLAEGRGQRGQRQGGNQ